LTTEVHTDDKGEKQIISHQFYDLI